eukprot:6173236-Pleurochrysis_carterae.AAC.3
MRAEYIMKPELLERGCQNYHAHGGRHSCNERTATGAAMAVASEQQTRVITRLLNRRGRDSKKDCSIHVDRVRTASLLAIKHERPAKCADRARKAHEHTTERAASARISQISGKLSGW